MSKKMEKSKSSTEVRLPRNAGSCIVTGFFLYADNFRRIFRLSWIPAVVYSILFAFLGSLCVEKLPRIVVYALQYGTLEGADYVLPLVLIALLFVLGGFVEVVFYSCGIYFLGPKEKMLRWFEINLRTAIRCILAALWWVLFTIIPNIILAVLFDQKLRFALLDPWNHKMLFSLTALFIIIVAVALLPMVHITMVYLMNGKTKMVRLIKTNYVMCMRRLPFILSVCLVNLLVIAIFGFIIQQPAIILLAANLFANIGTLYGDPLGMPHYISWLTFAVFFLAGFLQAYIRMSVVFTTYYMYGSIEAREEERRKAIDALNKDEE